MASKSYWQKVYIGGKSHEAIRSWFLGAADGMMPYKAEVLCDKATDREKKFRAFMIDAEGKRHQFERTLGGKNFTVTMKPVPLKATEEQVRSEPKASEPAPKSPPHPLNQETP